MDTAKVAMEKNDSPSIHIFADRTTAITCTHRQLNYNIDEFAAGASRTPAHWREPGELVPEAVGS